MRQCRRFGAKNAAQAWRGACGRHRVLHVLGEFRRARAVTSRRITMSMCSLAVLSRIAHGLLDAR
jgi:hypothetical protein